MNKVLLALQQLIKSAVLDATSPLNDIKYVIIGDPIKIPESNMPAILLKPLGTEYESRGSQYDNKIFRIDIILVYNAREFFKSGTFDDSKVYSIEDAINKMEKIDNNRKVLANTICGIVENNPCLPYTEGATTYQSSSLAKVLNVEYLPPATRERGFPTLEAIASIEVQAVGNR